MSDREFWEDIVSGLLNLVCIIERQKLKRKPDTAELRKAGKDALSPPVMERCERGE